MFNRELISQVYSFSGYLSSSLTMDVAVGSVAVTLESDSEELSLQNRSRPLLEERARDDESGSDTATESTAAPAPNFHQFGLVPSELEEQLQGYAILHTRSPRGTNPSLSDVDDHTSTTTDQHSPEAVRRHHVVTSAPTHETPPTAPAQSTDQSRWSLGGLFACLRPVAAYLGKDQPPLVKKDSWEIPFADILELDFIGSGSQGAVFVGECRGEKVAVKKVKDPSYCDGIRRLRKLTHPNIVVFK